MRKEYYKGIVIYLFDRFILIDKKGLMLTDLDLVKDFCTINVLTIEEGKAMYTIKGTEVNMYNFIKDLSFQTDIICR